MVSVEKGTEIALVCSFLLLPKKSEFEVHLKLENKGPVVHQLLYTCVVEPGLSRGLKSKYILTNESNITFMNHITRIPLICCSGNPAICCDFGFL